MLAVSVITLQRDWPVRDFGGICKTELGHKLGFRVEEFDKGRRILKSVGSGSPLPALESEINHLLAA